jgi:hypothetical protein
MGLHPTPNDAMLLPYMNSNLAQILRTWVASSVITGKVKLPAAIEGTNHSNTADRSNPKTLVNWSRPIAPIVHCITTTSDSRSNSITRREVKEETTSPPSTASEQSNTPRH